MAGSESSGGVYVGRCPCHLRGGLIGHLLTAGGRGESFTHLVDMYAPHAVADPTTAAAAVDVTRTVGRDNLQIAIDSLQFFRAGAEWDVLAAIPPEAMPYAQISDGPSPHLARLRHCATRQCQRE